MRNGPYTLIIAPDDWSGKRYRGRYCYEHIYAYWKHTGILPGPKELVHHINENKRYNRPDNLELIVRSAHTSLHNQDRVVPGIAFSCPCCGKAFTRTRKRLSCNKHALNRFCGRACAVRYNLHGIRYVAPATGLEPITSALTARR